MSDGELETGKKQSLTAMTDRDCLLMIFNAVCALAERLTGERMVVTIDLEGGGRSACFGDGVSWEKVSQEALVTPSYQNLERIPMPAEPS